MEARATGSCSRGFEAARRHPLEAAAEVLRGAGASLGGATKQERRPLVEAAGRRNGRGECMEALPVGPAGGLWQSWTEKREGGLHRS